MKKYILVFILFLSANCFSQCVDTDGIIQFFNLEGGFYGFISNDGKHYDIMNLPAEYKVDGAKVHIKGQIRNDITSVKNWGEIVQLNEIKALCPNNADESQKNFEMHEWGVMVGCYSSNQYFMTSRPEAVTYVKLPVIYFHSKNEMTLDLSVEFADGKPTDTYPKTMTENNRLKWENVKIYPECPQEKSVREKGIIDFVPLESILPTLNNVDANCIQYNGTSSKFLFYEGETFFDNKLTFNINDINREITLTNNFDYTIYKVAYTTQTGNFIHPDYISAAVDSIEAGQSVTIKYSGIEDKFWLNDLLNLGFNSSEAESFWKIWSGTFLRRSNAGDWGNLIYRIPEWKYDEIYKLNISSKPDKTIRAMYVLIHTDN